MLSEYRQLAIKQLTPEHISLEDAVISAPEAASRILYALQIAVMNAPNVRVQPGYKEQQVPVGFKALPLSDFPQAMVKAAVRDFAKEMIANRAGKKQPSPPTSSAAPEIGTAG